MDVCLICHCIILEGSDNARYTAQEMLNLQTLEKVKTAVYLWKLEETLEITLCPTPKSFDSLRKLRAKELK